MDISQINHYPDAPGLHIKIRILGLHFFYKRRQVLHDVNLDLPANQITAITGPSGSGKSTFLMVLNRLWEEMEGCTLQGRVEMALDGGRIDIHAPGVDVQELRRRVGMVFQQPNPLPMSIRRNVAFPLQLAHVRDKQRIAGEVERALRQVHLWDEVRDRLDEDGRALSGGQQQRLCLARALVLRPEVLLLDEPTASLDPAAAAAIEALLIELKTSCTLVMVSHYHDQIQRIADLRFEVLQGRFSQISPDGCRVI